MARMIPRNPPNPREPGGGAEADVFRALERHLDSSYTVFHSKFFFEPESRKAGEVDFLVVHRTRGLLYIEVKGEAVHKRDGHWYRGDKQINIGPYEQVKGHASTHTKLLGEEWKRISNGSPFPFMFGCAVAFPRTPRERIKAHFELPEELTAAAEDVEHIGDFVEAVMEYWNKNRPSRFPPLSEDNNAKFIEEVLNPSFSIGPTLGAGLVCENEVIDYNTLKQDGLFNVYVELSLEPSLRLKIKGGAGTGKTRLCVELARYHALLGKRVLLLCYNVYLATWLRQQVQDWKNGVGIDVWHFDGLCEEAIKKNGREPLENIALQSKEDRKKYFCDLLPNELQRAAADGFLEKWDFILVDEAQDFRRMNWIVLEECLRPGGTVVAFYDPQQDIFHASTWDPDLYHPFHEDYVSLPPLGINLRNSKRIVSWLQNNLACSISKAHFASPDGDVSPERRHQPEGNAGRLAIEALVAELTSGQKLLKPDQICILSLSSEAPTTLQGVQKLAGYSLTDNPFCRKGMILFTSARKFKGLESDAVIVIDVDPSQKTKLKANMLVACSRARHLLYVFEKQQTGIGYQVAGATIDES